MRYLLEELKLMVVEIIYDKHKSIPVILRERFPSITLSWDLWHICAAIGKGFSFLLGNLKKDATIIKYFVKFSLFIFFRNQLSDKIQVTKNHIWYAAQHCNANAKTMVDTVMNWPAHLANDHSKCAEFNPNAKCVTHPEDWIPKTKDNKPVFAAITDPDAKKSKYS